MVSGETFRNLKKFFQSSFDKLLILFILHGKIKTAAQPLYSAGKKPV